METQLVNEEWPGQSLADASDRQLTDLLTVRMAERDVSLALIKAINDEFARRYKSHLASLYPAAGKDHGQVRMQTLDGVTVKATINRKVEWDNDILSSIISTLPWDYVRNTFNIDLSLSENAYKKLPPELKDEVDEARTVTLGDIKVQAVVEPPA